MINRRWLSVTVLLLFAFTAIICSVDYGVDIFGVFRDARGRSLRVYFNERTAKYLLNERYVPQNFDALLIGSSSTVNWATDRIGHAHVYNESIDGGNAAEEQLLVQQALPTGHFQYALCLLSPFMTHSHNFQEGGMGKPSRIEALGSINILREELTAAMVRLHLQKPEFYPNGSKDLHTPKADKYSFPVELFPIDAEALDDYKTLVSNLHRHDIKVIFIEQPIYEPVYEQDSKLIDQYIEQTGLARPQDGFINFNSPKYLAFREQASNFDDTMHLSPAGAQQISSFLNSAVQQILSGDTQNFRAP